MLADVYFPDSEIGRAEARRLFPDADQFNGFAYAFCREYESDHGPSWRFNIAAHKDRGRELPCLLRDPRFLNGQNKCRRCPAGFAQEAAAGLLPEYAIQEG